MASVMLSFENVKLQAALRQQQHAASCAGAAHEAQQERPSCVKPRPGSMLIKDAVGHDALYGLTKANHLISQLPLRPAGSAREQAGAQTSDPYEIGGLTPVLNRRLIMCIDLLWMGALCLVLKQAATAL